MHYLNFQREESNILSGEKQLDAINSLKVEVVLSSLPLSLPSLLPSASFSEPYLHFPCSDPKLQLSGKMKLDFLSFLSIFCQAPDPFAYRAGKGKKQLSL